MLSHGFRASDDSTDHSSYRFNPMQDACIDLLTWDWR